jgi:site-specific DNA-methyltransferase (adenine-specific)
MADDFYTGIYNPDVLSCLANLSNDEVFTPPEIANQMLDMLPQELFSNPNTKFLEISLSVLIKKFSAPQTVKTA